MAARRVRRTSLPVLAIALLAPSVALGAGLEVPDNGAYVLARGGTAGGLDGTAYSLMFNPAGLTGVDSWDIRIDARLVDNQVTFQRASLPYNGGGGSTPVNFSPVSNSAGPSLAPSALIAYHPQGHILRQFAFGVGIYAPPGVAAYQFPDPTQILNQTENPDLASTESGQRYSLISNSNLILYPSIAIAWSPVHWLSVGLTVQSVYASVSFSQAIAGASVSGFESATNDAIAHLSVTDAAQPTFVAGIMLRPIKGLTIGGTFRPQVALDATGTIAITPPSQTPITINGDAASLKLNLAPEARLGFGYERGRFSIAADAVYEGWSVYRSLILSAPNVYVTQCSSEEHCTKTSLGTTTLPQDWSNTWSGRLGASYSPIQPTPYSDFGLQVHLGALFETNAVPAAYQSITEVTGNRVGFSTGLTFSYGDVALTIAGMYYVPVTVNVNGSQVTRSVATDGPDSPLLPNDLLHVANGTYTSNVWIASVGIGWTPHTSF